MPPVEVSPRLAPISVAIPDLQAPHTVLGSVGHPGRSSDDMLAADATQPTTVTKWSRYRDVGVTPIDHCAPVTQVPTADSGGR